MRNSEQFSAIHAYMGEGSSISMRLDKPETKKQIEHRLRKYLIKEHDFTKKQANRIICKAILS